ncbi:transcription factor S [archaeon]|nr:transcription factor S [archaeon]|tara:strand:+ start:22932 stop:23246 length:315 start_codon:yes stop_codon:yes gene_type:complete
MMFCSKCGSILFPDKDNPKKIKCSNCGYSSRDKKSIVIKEKTKDSKKIELVDKTIETLPKTEAECPKCGNKQAFYWLNQTRSGDEAETQFFMCVKCKHRWRSYD